MSVIRDLLLLMLVVTLLAIAIVSVPEWLITQFPHHRGPINFCLLLDASSIDEGVSATMSTSEYGTHATEMAPGDVYSISYRDMPKSLNVTIWRNGLLIGQYHANMKFETYEFDSPEQKTLRINIATVISTARNDTPAPSRDIQEDSNEGDQSRKEQ